MTRTVSSFSTARLGLFTAFTIGAGVPLMMFGRAIMQADLAVALIAALALAFLRPGTYRRAALTGRGVLGLALLITAIAWLPGMINSIELDRSLKAWARTFVFIAGATVMWAHLSAHPEERERCLKTLVTVSALALGAATVSLLWWPELVNILRARGDVVPRVALVFKSFGATAMTLVPVMVWGGWKLSKHYGKRWMWLGVFAALAAIVVVFETGNRASIAGLMAMVLLTALVLGVRDKRTRLGLLVSAPIVIAAMFVWVQFYGPTFLNTPDTYLPIWLVDPHRQLIWKFTFEHALNSPWVGLGIDNINLIAGARTNIDGMSQSYIPSHPHNWILEIFAETGLIGLTAAFTTLMIVVVKLLRAVLANRNLDANITLVALTAGFWTAALFNFSIWSTWWQLTYFVLFAIIAAWRQPQNDPQLRP